MTKHDKKWKMKYEQLVEFKREKGHCMVPHEYEVDKSLGRWVGNQRNEHKNNKLRLDRKIILDEIGFAWKGEGVHHNYDDKLWSQQHVKLVEFKRKYGHCMVPSKYEQDPSLGKWVTNQRTNHINNNIRRDRKELLDKIGFAWKVYILAASRASTPDVRSRVTGSFHTLHRSCVLLSFYCRLSISTTKETKN
jgi:uncharacterized protein YbgA (DUF1722 family)